MRVRVTQGTFSFLPDLTDPQIAAQVDYALARGWAVSVEHTADPHPRDVFWEMWGAPMFDLRDAAAVLHEVRACRAAFPGDYVKVNAFDSTGGWETVRLSFLAGRPPREAAFELSRRDGPGRTVRYELRRRAGGA
jgi:ribulose-bisphosphate carboxylase small chain